MPARKKIVDETVSVEKKAQRAPRKRMVKQSIAKTEESVQPQQEPVISIVIPAYNEVDRMVGTLVDAHRYFEGLGEPYEIIVVDDGSRDRTPEVAERLAVDIPAIRVVRMEGNSGKGAAVKRGMQEARGALRLFADADGSTPWHEFEKLARAIGAGAHVAIASRSLPESVIEPRQPRLRQLLGVGSRLIVQVTNVPGIKDTQCGFKLFTAPAAEAIFPQLTTNRWGFDIEALVVARLQNLPIHEIGVVWRDREGSSVKPSAYLQTLLENLRIRYNVFKGAYPKR
jgi:dolichyl-phosphate beta-glucosyltransferase